jgi:hypothetical protein
MGEVMKNSGNYKILFIFASGILTGAAVFALLKNPVNESLVVSPQAETVQKEAAVSGQSSIHVEIADLRREVALLRQQVTSLETQVASRTMAQSLAASASTNDEPKLSAEEEKALQEQAKALQQERLQLIKHSFNSERKDPKWAQQASSIINDAISRWSEGKNQSGYDLKQAECRSSLCRVEINFADSKGLSTFKNEFHRNLGASLPGMTMSANPNSDGSVTAVAYLVRDGDSFPE